MQSFDSKLRSIDTIGKLDDDVSFVLSYSCQDKINEEIDRNSNDWLRLHSILQNVKGKDISTMSAVLEKKKPIVVKVQSYEDALHEYNFHDKLKDLKGFIKYTCFFACNVTRSIFSKNKGHNLSDHRICESKGSSSGIIVMPYYDKGSFDDFLKKYEGSDRDVIIKTVIIKVVNNYFKAYNKLHFTHSDLFPKNIVMKTLKDPIIIDFKMSRLDLTSMTFWRDIQDFLGRITYYVKNTNDLDDLALEYCVKNIAAAKEPTRQIINNFVLAIKDIQL